MGSQVSPRQRQELRELVWRHRDVFAELPGQTSMITHKIVTEPGKIVRL